MILFPVLPVTLCRAWAITDPHRISCGKRLTGQRQRESRVHTDSGRHLNNVFNTVRQCPYLAHLRSVLTLETEAHRHLT